MIKAKLIAFGVERDLLTVSTSNFMKTSFIGKPKTGIKECFTTVSFVAEMYDCDILGAMGANRFKNEKLYYSFRRYKPQEGKIVFCKAGQEDITWFEYNFKDAIPISFYVEFDSQNSMIVTVIISAAMIDYRFFPNKTKWDEKSPTRYVDFNWQESYIEPKEVAATRTKENKVYDDIVITKVTGPYDKNGKKLNIVEKNETYFYRAHLKSTNIDVKKVNWAISYDDEKANKSYKLFSGGHIKNGTLEVKIQTEKAKEKFTIYAYTGNVPKQELSVYVVIGNISEIIFKGSKQWGSLQSGMARKNKKLTDQELNKGLDLIGKANVAILKSLNKPITKMFYERGPLGTRSVLSDNDDIEQKVIQNFYTGKLSKLSFDENSKISKTLSLQNSFKEYFENYLTVLKILIEDKKIKTATDQDIIQIFSDLNKSFAPNFSEFSEILEYDTYGFMGGTQSIKVDLEIIRHILVNGEKVNYYTIKTKMFIRDWYGADWGDINGWESKLKGNIYSLNAFFWLQHHYGCHPFETEIIYESKDKIQLYNN